MRLKGSTPLKYGLRMNMEDKYREIKKEISQLSGIPITQLLLVEIFGALIKVSHRSYSRYPRFCLYCQKSSGFEIIESRGIRPIPPILKLNCLNLANLVEACATQII